MLTFSAFPLKKRQKPVLCLEKTVVGNEETAPSHSLELTQVYALKTGTSERTQEVFFNAFLTVLCAFHCKFLLLTADA